MVNKSEHIPHEGMCYMSLNNSTVSVERIHEVDNIVVSYAAIVGTSRYIHDMKVHHCQFRQPY